MHAIEEYEQPLAEYFKSELAKIKGLTLYGPPKGHPCTSTIAFRLDGHEPKDVSLALGKRGIFTWNGNFYAVQLVKALGLQEKGGLVRIGLAPYNTKEEVDRAHVDAGACLKHDFKPGSQLIQLLVKIQSATNRYNGAVEHKDETVGPLDLMTGMPSQKSSPPPIQTLRKLGAAHVAELLRQARTINQINDQDSPHLGNGRLMHLWHPD